MSNFITALLLAVAFVALGGCGQTGPLYMPDEPPPQTEPTGTSSVGEQPQVTP